MDQPLSITFQTEHNGSRALLVSFEGIDGSGKSTLSSACTDALRNMGHRASRFINSSPLTGYWQTVVTGKKLMKEAGNSIPPAIDQSLHTLEFLAYCRCELPALMSKNDFVISDRYTLGKRILTELDTGTAHNWPGQLIDEMEGKGEIPSADICFLLKIPPIMARKRIESRGGPIEDKESIEMLTRAALLLEQREHEANVRILDARLPLETLINQAVSQIISYNPKRDIRLAPFNGMTGLTN